MNTNTHKYYEKKEMKKVRRQDSAVVAIGYYGEVGKLACLRISNLLIF